MTGNRERAQPIVVVLAAAMALAACVGESRIIVEPTPAGAPGVPVTEFRHVQITVGSADGESDPRCGDGAVGSIEVEPFIATIFTPGEGDKPRQVRWVVEGLEPGDLLFIRPTKGSSKRLFRPETEGVFAVPGAASPAVESGRPVQPRFEPRRDFRTQERILAARPHAPNPDGEAIAWRYEIEVERRGERLYCDPEVMVERDT